MQRRTEYEPDEMRHLMIPHTMRHGSLQAMAYRSLIQPNIDRERQIVQLIRPLDSYYTRNRANLGGITREQYIRNHIQLPVGITQAMFDQVYQKLKQKKKTAKPTVPQISTRKPRGPPPPPPPTSAFSRLTIR